MPSHDSSSRAVRDDTETILKASSIIQPEVELRRESVEVFVTILRKTLEVDDNDRLVVQTEMQK